MDTDAPTDASVETHDARAPGLFARMLSRLRRAEPDTAIHATPLLPSPGGFPPARDAESSTTPRLPSSESSAASVRNDDLDASLDRIKRHLARTRRPQRMAAQTVRLETPITRQALDEDPMRPTRVATSLVTQLPPGSRIVSLVVEIPTD